MPAVVRVCVCVCARACVRRFFLKKKCVESKIARSHKLFWWLQLRTSFGMRLARKAGCKQIKGWHLVLGILGNVSCWNVAKVGSVRAPGVVVNLRGEDAFTANVVGLC